MHERMIEAFSGSRGWRLGRRQSVRVLQASWTSPRTMGLAGRRAYSSNRGMIHLGAVPGWVIDRVPSLGNGWGRRLGFVDAPTNVRFSDCTWVATR